MKKEDLRKTINKSINNNKCCIPPIPSASGKFVPPFFFIISSLLFGNSMFIFLILSLTWSRYNAFAYIPIPIKIAKFSMVPIYGVWDAL